MAHVFLVRNRSLQRLAAIKVLSPELADDEVSRKRFVREARAAARITHPNVTSVYTVGTLGNGLPFIEMQYVEGPNLAELVRSQGPLEPSRATSLLIQIAGALAAAHDCRVIHRDVKPANVLIDREQTHAFLTDFGVAGILETGTEAITRLTRASDRLGNPDYMSPEQLRGESVTEHSDVYSFGILGYELLTGHGPFGASEVGDVAAAHIRKAPLDLHEAYPRIPAALADALKRCLAKKPEHRPSARVLADLLRDDQPAVVAEPGAGSGPANAFTDFLSELQKRKVYSAAVTYGVVTFAVLQGADLILPALNTGDAVYRVLVIAFLSGFPVAMWLSWVYDLNRGRLERADDLDASFARRASRGQRIALQSLGLALSVGIAIGIAVWLL
jgi:serine/threonine protein kinase